MKTPFFFLTVLAFAGILFTAGCEKEAVSPQLNPTNDEPVSVQQRSIRAYHDNFDTWYQFAPDIEGGWQEPNPFPGWYYGGGKGNATHMGKTNMYFNQYIPFNPPFFNSEAAPVNMFFANELLALGYSDIPEAVSAIVYDDKGNSIWFRLISASSTPVSPTRVEFTGTEDIIGGTGKFAGATGHVALHGYFNPQDQEDAEFGSDGWIEY